MFRRRLFLIAIPVVLLLVVAAGVAVWFARPKKTEVVVEVTGTRGLAIKGTCEVDGSSRDLSGTVPTQFVLEGYRMTYSLTTPEETGEFRVKASNGDRAYGSAGSLNPPKYGVRGWVVKSGWVDAPPVTWIEPFEKDGQEGWGKPPPP
jgi:hypothetical protein